MEAVEAELDAATAPFEAELERFMAVMAPVEHMSDAERAAYAARLREAGMVEAGSE